MSSAVCENRQRLKDAAEVSTSSSAREAALENAIPEDVKSLAALYDEYAIRVFSLAIRILREVGDAEEVVQDVFMYAWTQRLRYDRARGSVCAWLLMLTRSRSIDRLRAKRRSESRWYPCSQDPGTLVAPKTADLDAARIVRDAVALLPAEQRRALELAFFEGYSHTEVAAILKQPLGTIKTRIRVALVRLRHAIERDSPDQPATRLSPASRGGVLPSRLRAPC